MTEDASNDEARMDVVVIVIFVRKEIDDESNATQRCLDLLDVIKRDKRANERVQIYIQ
jgi:hypothetical protein